MAFKQSYKIKIDGLQVYCISTHDNRDLEVGENADMTKRRTEHDDDEMCDLSVIKWLVETAADAAENADEKELANYLRRAY